jgi:hypothetical protein
MLLLGRIRICVDGHRKYHSFNTSLDVDPKFVAMCNEAR